MLNTKRLTLFAITTIGAVILTGFCQGVLINRWGEADAQALADFPVDRLPLSLGNWQGETIERPASAGGKGVAYFSRRYVNSLNGKSVMLSLTWGKPGPVAVHTPDVCYGSSGFETSAPTKFSPTFAHDQPAQFFTSQFKKTTASGSQNMRAFWAWSAGRGWLAPDNARLTFARQPTLVKAYFIDEMSKDNVPLDANPCLELMPLLLPEIQAVFFAPANP